MAAITDNTNFFNMTSDKLSSDLWLTVGNLKTISMTTSIPSMVMSPVIVCGNLLLVLSVWKDPLKKLRSLPSNRIIASMAIADLLVGLVVCPLMVYWGWAIFQNKNLTFPALKAFSVLVDVSAGHVLLLTVDRVFALVIPLQYRVNVTNRRVCIESIACWAYFILSGCAFGLWAREDLILGIIFNLQSFCILIGILVLHLVILFAFRKHRKTIAAQAQSTANRQMMLQRERKTIQGHCNRYLCVSYMLRTVVYSAVFVLFLCTVYPSIIAVDVSLYIDCCVIVCQFRSKPIFVRVAASPVPRYVQILFEKSERVLFH